MSKLYRQLFRLIGIGPDFIAVVCPGWDSETLARIPFRRIPEWLHDYIKACINKPVSESVRFYARCDLGADFISVFQNSIQDFEPAPQPSPKDGLA